MDTTRASTLAGRTNTATPTAEQVVDGPDQSVLLDLGPVAAQILTDLARALHTQKETWVLRALGTVHPNSEDHTRYLGRLLSNPGVVNALQVLITDAGAADLAEQLDNAALQRGTCHRSDCDDLETDGHFCPGHRHAAERGVAS